MEFTEEEKTKLIINAAKNVPIYLERAKKTFEIVSGVLKNDFLFLSNKYFEGFQNATGKKYEGDDINMKNKWLIFLQDSRENMDVIFKELQKEEPFIDHVSGLALFKPKE